MPLGCLATAGVLFRGVLAMYQGDKKMSQQMMRAYLRLSANIEPAPTTIRTHHFCT